MLSQMAIHYVAVWVNHPASRTCCRFRYLDVMILNEITLLVESYLGLARNDQEPENAKFDFKREWWKLNNDEGIAEFLKDTSSIANTVGPDGYIAIGFDAKAKVFHDAVFTDCGLKDSSQLPDVVNKHVDRLYTVNSYDIGIEGHKMSVLHIPPSIDKPHVIRLHKVFSKGVFQRDDNNRIWVRKNTKTQIASKYDLDLMYYDRKNILPDYMIATSFAMATVSTNTENRKATTTFTLTLENIGRRPVAIDDISFVQKFTYGVPDYGTLPYCAKFTGSPICIAIGAIYSQIVKFTSLKFINDQTDYERSDIREELTIQRSKLKDIVLILQLSNGEVIQSTPFVKE